MVEWSVEKRFGNEKGIWMKMLREMDNYDLCWSEEVWVYTLQND